MCSCCLSSIRAPEPPVRPRAILPNSVRRHIDYITSSMYELLALLIEGRLPETVHRRSEVWRPAMRLVTAAPGRSGAPPARHYDLAARSSLHGLRRTIPQTEARPPATNRHGGAPKGARPASWDAGCLASTRPRRVMCGPTGCRCTRAPVGAPPTPQRWEFNSRPGRNRAAGTRCAVRTGCLTLLDQEKHAMRGPHSRCEDSRAGPWSRHAGYMGRRESL